MIERFHPEYRVREHPLEVNSGGQDENDDEDEIENTHAPIS